MIRLLLAFILALAPFALPAKAGTAVTGTRLLAWCNSGAAEDQKYCLGYILSVGDILNDQTIYKGRACLPSTLSADQLQQTVVAFLRANANLLDGTSGANLAALAMMDAFPCSNS